MGLVLASLTLGLAIYAVASVLSAVQTRMAADPAAPPARERVFAVNLVTAVSGPQVPVLRAYGEIESRRRLELRTPVGGRVVRLAEGFVEGGRVAPGDLLVEIDPADATSALDRAAADVADAGAEQRDAVRGLGIAQDDLASAEEQSDLRARAYRRQTDLEARGVATAAAVEAAELAAAAARQAVLSRRQALAQAEVRVDLAATRLERAEIARDEARRRLADTRLEAGFAGTLSDVAVVEGRLVAANEQLATLVDPAALEVAFRVSTSQYARLLDRDGALIEAPVRAVLDVAAADLVATGRISRAGVGAGADRSGRVIYARLEEAAGFRPGDFVTVEVEEPALADVVVLPSAALGSDGAVLVLGTDDRLEALAVDLVRRQGNEVLVRGDGLAGREVVAARTPVLGPGIKVRPLRGGAPDPDAAPDTIELTTERRARLVAFVEASERMPAEAKARMLEKLAGERVPAQLVERIESRMGS